MARVKQYPHYLFVETPGDSVQDENGDYGDAEIQRTLIGRCREESDGRGQEYDVGGGKYIKSTSVIQCPKSCPAIAKGTGIIVANDEECSDIRVSGIVLNCDASQLHTRIWV